MDLLVGKMCYMHNKMADSAIVEGRQDTTHYHIAQCLI